MEKKKQNLHDLSEYKEIFEQMEFERFEEEVIEMKELDAIEDTLEKPDTDIPMVNWIVMSCYANKGITEAIRAVHDAYKLGFMLGKKEGEK